MIYNMISDKVIVKSKPAIYLSGGLDSTIILHHLREKTTEDIYSYTAKFNSEFDECDDAKQVAEHYGTIHTEVEIDNLIDKLPEILKYFDRPRYNVWGYFLTKKVKEDGRLTVYGGEGGDEHFGGYECSYLEGWANQIAYISPTYLNIHDRIGVNLERPFLDLDWQDTFKYYAPSEKWMLRKEYALKIPDFVIGKKKTPPAFTNWIELWEKELHIYFPNYKPKNETDVKLAMQAIVAEKWRDAIDYKFGQYYDED